MRIETWKDGVLIEVIETPDVVSVPVAVSMRQARLALLNAGKLDAAGTALLSMPRSAQIEWEYSTEVRRDSALVVGVGSTLGLTESQIDDLFIAASVL